MDGDNINAYPLIRCPKWPVEFKAESARMSESDKLLIFGVVVMLLANLALFFPAVVEGERRRGLRRSQQEHDER
jgi:hypothetical protein